MLTSRRMLSLLLAASAVIAILSGCYAAPVSETTEHVRRSHKLMVKFPAGIDDGQTLRVRGEGNTGLNGGPSGDLMVTGFSISAK